MLLKIVPVDYVDDSDIKNMNNAKNSGNDSCNNQINDVFRTKIRLQLNQV